MRVAELAPVWQAASQRVSDLSLLIGSGVIGLGVGAWRLRQLNNRPAWLFILSSLGVFLLLCIRSVRFAVYPAALGAVPLAAWATTAISAINRRGLLPSLRRVFAMSVVVVGMAYPFLVAFAFEGSAPVTSSPGCDLDDVLPEVRAELGGREGLVVLSSLDSGPELMYRFPVGVVADPYHRNVEGILDSYAIFSAENEFLAADLLAKHQVSYVLVCENDADASVHDADGLYFQLLAGQPLEGLGPIPLDSPAWRLYVRN
jgi:hypothetical protein